MILKYYTYKAFGLFIRSEFEIPEFILDKGNPDVEISLDLVPINLKKVTKRGVKFQATHNEFLLTVDKVARFYVKMVIK